MTATRLPDGRVLVTGGAHTRASAPVLDVVYFSRAEIFDLAAGAFTLLPDMAVARDGHRATALSDGRVLITGGASPVPTPSAELFATPPDAVAPAFTSAGEMTAPRTVHTATRLDSGAVLVAGGTDVEGRPLASAELYAPCADEPEPPCGD